MRRGTWKDQEFKAYNFDALGVQPPAGNLHPLLKVCFPAVNICLLWLAFCQVTCTPSEAHNLAGSLVTATQDGMTRREAVLNSAWPILRSSCTATSSACCACASVKELDAILQCL